MAMVVASSSGFLVHAHSRYVTPNHVSISVTPNTSFHAERHANTPFHAERHENTPFTPRRHENTPFTPGVTPIKNFTGRHAWAEKVESAEDYNDGGDILGEDGDEVGSVEEMYDNEGGSGELGDGMSPEYESDYNNGVDGYLSMNNFPDIVHEEEANGEEVGYSGSFESDPIPMPQERVESSPSGSPSERFMAAARSAASRVLGLGRRDLSEDFDAGRRRDLHEDFDAGRRRGSRRSSRPPQRFSPSAKRGVR
eukprot:scaffold6268_cov125-Skeletonema_marinoi.AAC.2